MAWQLVYTSAPRLLDAGRSGFGTVARHRDIPPMVVQSVERLSQFARLPGLNPERVIYSHRLIQISSTRYHVLSMIRSAGSDYTGRTNHIAHHLIATDREVSECAALELTPADVLANYPWLSGWTEAPRYLDAAEEVRLARVPAYTLQYSVWDPLTENPAHAWLLITHPFGRSCYVKAPAGTDFRLLFLESLRGLAANSWQPTFVTSLEPTDDAGDFRWIGLDDSSPSVVAAENSGRPILDLTRPHTLPEPDVPQQVIPAPSIAAVPQVQLRRTLPPPSAARSAAPFVEKVFEASVPEDHSHPISLRLKQKTSHPPGWDAEPSANHEGKSSAGMRSVIFAVLAIAGAAMLLSGFWRRQAAAPSSEKVTANEDRSPARQIKEEKKTRIKALLGNDAFFSASFVDDLSNSNLDGAQIDKYCGYLKSLVQAYRQIHWNSLPETVLKDPSGVPTVGYLKEHIEKLKKICDRPLLLKAEATDPDKFSRLIESLVNQVGLETDSRKNESGREFTNFLNNTRIARDSDLEHKTERHIEDLIKSQFQEYLIKMAEDPKIHMDVDKEPWADAIRQLSSLKDLTDKEKLLSAVNACRPKPFRETSIEPSRPPSPAPGQPATVAGNSVKPEKDNSTSRSPESASKVHYIFCGELPEIEVPGDSNFFKKEKGKEVSMIQYRTLAGTDIEKFSWRVGRGDFEKEKDARPWFNLDNSGRGTSKLIAADAAKTDANSLPVFQMTLTDFPDRAYIVVGGRPDPSSKDQPIIPQNPVPEFTMDTDHILKGDFFRRIECTSGSQLGIRFKGSVASNLEKMRLSAFPIDASNRVNLQVLQNGINAQLSPATAGPSHMEQELSIGIEHTQSHISELEGELRRNPKSANAAEWNRDLKKYQETLANDQKQLDDIRKNSASKASPEAAEAAKFLTGVFFKPSALLESPATLLLVVDRPGGRVEFPICDVKIQFR